MTRRLAAVLFGVGLLRKPPILLGADPPENNAPRQSFEVTTTERAHFLPGGTLRLNASYGYLSVDGWEAPEVEATIVKSTNHFYEPGRQEEAKRRLDRIRVVTEHPSDREFSITTILASRNGDWSPPLPPATEAGVTLEYRIHVPRDSRLLVKHGNGYVWVSDIQGDIEVRSHTGDMIVMLPDPGPYAIDARTRLGSVLSDLTGHASHRFVTGTHFVRAATAPSLRVYLRMGRGSITIKNGPPLGPNGKN